jgi:hypothetical protein
MKHDETTLKHTKKITSLASETTDSNTLSSSNGCSWQKELRNNITSAQEIAQKNTFNKGRGTKNQQNNVPISDVYY